MKYTSFHEDTFRQQVDKALQSVKTILDVNRSPRYAEDQDHDYLDKYALAELLTNTAIAAQVNVLEQMGLDETNLSRLGDFVHQDKRSVTLRFAAEDTCTFLNSQDVNVATHQNEHVMEISEESSGLIGTSKTKQTVTRKVVSTVREYHWKVGVQYKIFCFAGNNPDKEPIELQSRSSSTVIITQKKDAILPQRTVRPPIDVSLTWLLQQITTDKQLCRFKINRSVDTCRTPRRNDDIDAAFDYFDSFRRWSIACSTHFKRHVEGVILGNHKPGNAAQPAVTTQGLSHVDAENVFIPVLPLFESPRELAGTATRQQTPASILSVSSTTQPSTDSPLLSVSDIDKFLNEQIRSLNEKKAALVKSFPPSQLGKLISEAEATLVLLWDHSKRLTQSYRQSIEYIEGMLRKQLIAAIGKELQPKDFDQFMRFHLQKIFGPAYAPKPFCYAIRRPDHYPDGILSIECNTLADDKIHPVDTIVRTIDGGSAPPMYFPINAATTVEFTGPRYLHGWIQHRFMSSPSNDFKLTARARQFSSFLLMIGTVSGPDQFSPKDAIILQNKDEVIIPLILNELPTATEFKDAISSLSPEQQRFAKSFRGMQLESSVFGVCMVQLKPQLEALLGLPMDALTKEIRLTQDLLSLFIEYQIPSDLLSFDGAMDASFADKVNIVKGHVKAVQDVIGDAKKKQLKEVQQMADMRIEKSFGSHVGGTGYFSLDGLDVGSVQGGSSSDRRRLSNGHPQPGGVMSEAPRVAFSSCSSTHAELQHEAPLLTTTIALAVNATLPLNPTRDSTVLTVSPGQSESSPSVDFTMIPRQLDAKFEQNDSDSALRATVIEAGENWTRMRQEDLLTLARATLLTQREVKTEKDKAFDLLDALSRSGSLPIACAELHVVVAVTHCFENDVMGTVIQDNVNPIEKVEKTCLMMGSTIHDNDASQLLRNESQVARLSSAFPALFTLTSDQEE